MRFLPACLALLAVVTGPALAQVQEPSAIERAAADFARAQAASLPGEVQVSAGPVDSRLRLPACERMEAFLPPGARLWGNGTVGVRCPGGWSVYVPVTVRVIAPAVFAARNLAAGRALSREDLVVRQSDLTQLPANVLGDPGQAVGKSLVASLAAGQPLRSEQLRAALAVVQGQTVRLVAQGGGVTVSSEGRALGNAAAGQSVSVRTASGQVVTGTARAGGVVEVGF